MQKILPDRESRGFTVKTDSVSIRGCHATRVIKGRSYDEFTVSHYDEAGQRVRRRFGNEDDARTEANRVAKSISQGKQAEAALGSQNVLLLWSARSICPSARRSMNY